MRMKKKRWWLSLLLAMTALVFGVIAAACESEEEQPNPPTLTEGKETGVYYYDSDSGEEYLITLNNGNKFAFLVKDANESGTYALEGETLTFTFNNEKNGTLDATLSSDVLTVTYDGSEMRFLRKIAYTVTFDSCGGSAVSSATVINGRTVSKPSDPTRDGYVFIGWYTSEDYTEIYSFDSQIVTANLSVYARWAEVDEGKAEYTVDFDLGYEAENPASVQTVGGKIYNTPVPVREGYTFKGWWVSAYDDGSKLTYRYTEDTAFVENTTLFAVWESNSLGSKLATPYVQVSGNTVSWESVSGASTYSLTISGPSGFTKISESQLGSTSYNVDFASAPEGDYTITVVAKAAGSESNNSDTAYCYYVNKALARVSLFSVNDAGMLIFNGVANAEKYYVTVVCGNAEHNHTMFDNGTSTYYNFSNCTMREGGITFVVTTTANGYASSVSRVFVYERNLSKATGLTYDNETDTLSWNATANATTYLVTVTINGETETIDVGSSTSYNLKNYPSGAITLGVIPKAAGYNSPEAATCSVNKTTLAVPQNIRVLETVVSWDEVEGATSYEIMIGNRSYTSNTNSFDLTSATDTTWKEAEDYQMTIRAIGSSAQSLWSDVVDMRYYALYSTIVYSQNTVSWRHVIGATRYEVRVNGGAAFAIKDGSNYAEVTLTQSGYNTIEVRFYDEEYSDWVSVQVYAYEITFDSREGESVDSVYVAFGDVITLSEATRAGYDFSGWYTTPGGAAGNAAQYEGGVYAENGDTVLYAYWTPKSYELTLNYGDYGDSSAEPEPVKVQYRANYTLPVPVSTNGNYGFIGYYTALTGGTRLTDETGVSINGWQTIGDATVYAHWAATLSYAYDSTTKGYAVSKGDGIVSVSEVTVPETYDDGIHGELKVTVVRGFSSTTSLVKIYIPDTVESIETTAFTGCTNLQEINVIRTEGNNTASFMSVDGVVIKYTAPESGDFVNSTIDDTDHGDYQLYIFPRGKGGDYVVPDFVTDIRGEICKSNTNLTSLTISASVTNISASAFYSCTKLTSVTFISNYEEGAELVIGKNAFYNNTSLTEINLPAQLSEFDSAAFTGCTKLTDINVDEQNVNYSSIDGVLCDADATTLIYFPIAREGSYTVPSKIRVIGTNAFYSSKISSITIHSGVTNISSAAFYGCKSLTEVIFTSPVEGAVTEGITIESSETYSTGAFYNCTVLTDIVFMPGSKLVSIGDFAFYNCTALSGELELPATLKYIGKSAFYSTGYTSIVFKAAEAGQEAEKLDIADGVSATSGGAFYKMSSLTSVTFEEGSNVRTIGKFAFASITTLVGEFAIPATVEKINEGAFYQCKGITDIVFKAAPAGTEAASLVIEDGSTTSKGAFYYLTALRSLTFEEGSNVNTIGNYTFYYCTALREVTFSPQTQRVGDYAFMKCTALQQVTFSEGDTQFGESVFSGCTSLKTIYIGANVKALGSDVFEGCTYLTEVIVDPANTYYASVDGVLYGIDEQGDPISLIYCPSAKASGFTIPATVTEIGAGVFQGRTALTSITIGKNIVKIGAGAFKGCTALATVTFESGRTEELTIEREAFSGCTALDSITIPATVTYIGYAAFYKCLLSTLTFEDADNANGLALEIADGSSTTGAFAYGSFTELKLPERLTRIGAYAFAYCKQLTSIVIPKNVQNGEYVEGEDQPLAIGKGAFYFCSALTSVEFEKGGTGDLTIGTVAFGYCSGIATFSLPARLATATSATGEVLYPLGATTANTPYVVFYNSAPIMVYYDYTAVTYNMRLLESIDIEEGNKYYISHEGILYSADGSTVMYVPMGKKNVAIWSKATTIDATAFYQAFNLETLTIEDGDEDFIIPDAANNTYSKGVFAYCNKLREVTFSARVKSIGSQAFHYALALTTVNFDTTSKSRLESIGQGAFYNCKQITELYFPGSLTEIGPAAFAGCYKLTTVVFAEGSGALVIQDATFTYDTRTRTTTPELGYTGSSYDGYSYTGYGSNGTYAIGAFMYCWDLKSVTLPSNLTTLGDRAFFGCESLTDITFTGESNLSDIKTKAFGRTGVTEFVFPESSEKIVVADAAFDSCSALQAVTLSGSISSDFSFSTVFSNCPNIQDIAVSAAGTSSGFTSDNGVLYYNGELLFYSSLKTEKSYTLPSGVSSIASSAFNSNPYLEKVTLDAELTAIGDNAFYNCTALKTVEMPLGKNHGQLQTIGIAAFKNTVIEELTVPYTVTSIGKAAFAYCKSLKTVTFEEGGDAAITLADGTTTNNSVNDGIFNYCTALETVNLSSRVTTIGAYAFSYCSVLNNIDLSKVKTINNRAFYYCKGLTAIDISNLSEVDYAAFYYCSSLTEVEIPVGVTTLPKALFAYCTALTKVTFAERSTNITVTDASGSTTSAGAFYQCIALTEFTIPEYITNIGTGMFAASGLKSIVIPETVKTIGKSAFASCKSLKSVTIEDRTKAVTITPGTSTTAAYASGAFNGCTALESIDLSLADVDTMAYLFYGCTNLQSVTLPDGITSIGDYAFYNCSSLKDYVIPDTVTTIGKYSFSGCILLDTIEISEKVTSIGQAAFQGSGIKSVVIPATLTTIGKAAFAMCESLSSVTFENRTKALTITAGSANTVGNYGAFQGCTLLKSIELPAYYTTIGMLTFANSGLESITIPKTVTTIGKAAFYGCSSLKTVEFEAGGTSALTFTAGSGTAVTTAGAFALCAMESVELPGRLNGITAYTFYNCTDLKTVTFEQNASKNNLATINTMAFYLSGLESITLIPKTVKTINKGAFALLTDLKEVTFEEGGTTPLTIESGTSVSITSTTVIDDNGAFRGCTSLTGITLPERLTTIGNFAFYGSGLTSIKIPKGVTSVGKGSFYGCTALESVEFEEGGTADVTITAGTGTTTTTVGAFLDCTALESVTLPAKLTDIPAYTFYNCTALNALTIPEGVKSIGNYAFRYCSSLASVTVPANVSSVGAGSFANCTSMTGIEFKSGVTTLGNLVFENCSNLQSVIIPDTVTSIGTNPFYGCKKLTSLDVSGSSFIAEATADYVLLYNGDKSTLCAFIGSGSITLPESVKTVATYAFGNSNVTSVSFKNPDTVIQNYAFWCAFNLDSITLPANLTAIETATFYNCTSLTEIVLPSTLESIGNGAFTFSALTSVTIPNSVTLIGQGAFAGSDLEKVVFEAGGEEELVLTAGTSAAPTSYTGAGVFQGCTALTDVTFTDRITTISAYAFYGAGLLTIDLPESVTALGKYAFYGNAEESLDLSHITTLAATTDTYIFAANASLRSVILSEEVDSIANYMFYDCAALESITIPANIVTIGTGAFGNSGLKSVYIPNTVATIGLGAFAGSEALASVEFEEGEETLAVTGGSSTSAGAFMSTPALTSVTIPSRMTTVSAYMFAESGLTSVTLPETVISIGNYAFYGCSIAQIEFPAMLATVGDYAFAGAPVTSLSFGAYLTSLGSHAFEDCAELVSVEFDQNCPMTYFGGTSSTTTMGYTFRNCVKLESITIPNNVIRIGAYMFEGCESLKEFIIPSAAGNVAIATYAFYGTAIESFDFSHVNTLGTYSFANTPIKSVVLSHTSLTSITEGAFQNCTQLVNVEMTDAVLTIVTYAFQNCTALESLNISEGVYRIYDYAFDGCTSLKSVIVPSKLFGYSSGGIGSYAFNGWTSSQTIYMEGYEEDETGYGIGGTGWTEDWAEGCNATIVWDYTR